MQGFWYDPDLKDTVTHKFHVGMSHLLAKETVISADYSHIIGLNGWRTINVNPLLDDDNNPATARVRPMAPIRCACSATGTTSVRCS